MYPVTLSFPSDIPVCVEAGKWEYSVYEWQDGEPTRRLVATYTEPYTLALALVLAGVLTPREAAGLLAKILTKIRGGHNA